MMIYSSCHCGNLKLEIHSKTPESLTSCNCSICKRYGSLLAYFNPKDVNIIFADSLDEYSWGDKSLAFVRCSKCGCFSYWKSLNPNYTEKMGVNARLFTNIDINEIPIRKFDGADTWEYLD